MNIVFLDGASLPSAMRAPHLLTAGLSASALALTRWSLRLQMPRSPLLTR